MSVNLFTSEEWNLIFESLKYTKIRFEEYSAYPSEDFKRARVEEVNKLLEKIRKLTKG
jgi:hypothetical protein